MPWVLVGGNALRERSQRLGFMSVGFGSGCVNRATMTRKQPPKSLLFSDGLNVHTGWMEVASTHGIFVGLALSPAPSRK